MALKKISLKTTPDQAKKRLDQVLAELLPGALEMPLSKAKVRKLIVAGAVYLNGKRIRIASKEILANARIEVFVDLARLQEDGPAKDVVSLFTAERVLFEDEYLIVVDKPAGLPTQPTLDEARDNLFAQVKKFLAARDGLPQPYVGLHHRLDRDTSGVILFTKKTEANAGIAQAFAQHELEKVYQALAFTPAQVKPPAQWQVKNYLAKDKKQSAKRAVFTAVKSGGDFAQTEFKLLENLKHAIWVEAKPKTGRTHQIRVHLSEEGMPILGDATYGGTASGTPPAPRLMLHAHRLTFHHPITKFEISVLSPLPKDFAQCLQGLRKQTPVFRG